MLPARMVKQRFTELANPAGIDNVVHRFFSSRSMGVDQEA